MRHYNILKRIIVKLITFTVFHVKHILGFFLAITFLLFYRSFIDFAPIYYKGVPSSFMPSSISYGDILLFGLLIIYPLFFRSKTTSWNNKIPLILLLVLFSLLSIRVSQSILPAIIFLLRLIGFYILLSDKSIRNSFLYLLIGVTTLLALFQFFLQHSIGIPLEPVQNLQMKGIAKIFIDGTTILRPAAFFQHPNISSGFLLIAILMLIKNFRDFNKSHYVAFTLCATGILLSGSRSSVLGLLIIFSILTLNKVKTSSFSKLLLTMILLIIPFIPLYVFRSNHTENENPIRYRSNVIIDSLSSITTKTFLFGDGIKSVLNPNRFDEEPFYTSQPPHNSIVFYFLSIGLLPGSFILYLLWFYLKPIQYVKFIPLLPIILLDYYLLSPVSSYLFIPLILYSIQKDVSRETSLD